MKVKILQHYTPNWKPLIDISRPIHEEYCKRHGYELVIKEVPEYPVYNGLEKLEMISDNLKFGDISLVLDADTVITNLSTKIESFCDTYFMCVSEGFNMGVFLFNMSPFSTLFLGAMIKNISEGFYNCEQDYIEDFITGVHPHKRYIKVEKHPCFNSYIPELYSHISNPEEITEQQGRWVEGKSFILHLPSLGMDKRLEIMKSVKIIQ